MHCPSSTATRRKLKGWQYADDFTDLDEPRGLRGGENAVGFEPEIQLFPLEDLLVENDELVPERADAIDNTRESRI